MTLTLYKTGILTQPSEDIRIVLPFCEVMGSESVCMHLCNNTTIFVFPTDKNWLDIQSGPTGLAVDLGTSPSVYTFLLWTEDISTNWLKGPSNMRMYAI